MHTFYAFLANSRMVRDRNTYKMRREKRNEYNKNQIIKIEPVYKDFIEDDSKLCRLPWR